MYHLGTQRIGASIVGNTTPAIVRYISSDRRNTNRATNGAIMIMIMTTGIVVTIGTGTTIMTMDTRTDALAGSRAARIGDTLAIERAPEAAPTDWEIILIGPA
jgi:N-acetylglucosamine kinase-like BadF-type ATPase